MSSSEDEFSPRPRAKHAAHDVPVDEHTANGISPRAGSNGPARAPPPTSPSQGKAGIKGMGLADQIAFGTKTARELVQVSTHLVCCSSLAQGVAPLFSLRPMVRLSIISLVLFSQHYYHQES